jgi:hypothetical protein
MYRFASIIILSSLFAQHVHAAPQYSVAPLIIDESLEARDIVTREITITHTGGEPATLYPSVNNISLKEGGVIEEFLAPVDSDRTASLAAWIELNRSGIDMQPGETKTIPITFRINGNVAPGEYHAFIGFGYGRNRDEAEAQVKAGRAPGTVINVTIADKSFSLLKIASFVVDRFVTRAENQAAVYTFQNPGEEALTPKGDIIIYNQRGAEVATLPVNSEGISVPPGGTHVFTAQVPVKGLFGKYKAFLSVEYGSTQRGSVQDTSFFYIIPWKFVLLVCMGIAVIVAYLAWHAHRRYFDDTVDDDHDQLLVRVRDGASEPKEHDLHIKRP